ncbi:MAG: primosomal protein N' [Bacillaceae bacterium]|nr:primosomal protein N' [Bacillaceae bacterium]
MIARVVVDVPVLNTDKTFDYRIPDHLTNSIQVGSRVIVPFGPRKIQGFVIAVTDDTDGAVGPDRLRDVEEVPDPEPPLTEELVQLGIWMSRRYICYKFTALESMVPAVMRSRYEKWVSLDPEQLERIETQVFLTGEGEQAFKLLKEIKHVEWKHLLQKCPGDQDWLEQGVKEGWLLIEREVKDRVTRKTVSVVTLLLEENQLPAVIDELPAQAVKQKEILRYFLHRPGMGSVRLKELLAEVGTIRQTVNRLVEKGFLKIEEVQSYRNPYEGIRYERQKPPQLTAEQKQVIHQILPAVDQGRFHPYLLHGVTGSGKTEIYLRVIERVLELGKQAIVLVPEISLTPQMVERFKGRFGEDVAVLHSRLSGGERFDEWRRIKEGKARVAIGARSAVFAPFENLGLIIIDEEHESSYKQEENPRYHARDIAMYRGKYHQAVVLLGSATPSLEAYHRAREGKITLLTLKERIGNRPMPEVQLVDMREELRNGNRSMFSRVLTEKIEDRLDRGEQMVLFLNRRGFSTFVMCRSCGHVMECPHCDISLTYHRKNRAMRCHYCGYAEKEPDQCPCCSSRHIRYFGTGTQRVEEELSRHFPGIRVIRMDVDTTSRKGAHEALLSRFKEGKGDVLLGTQMIAKGLDFERVSLVGVIAADTVLHLPDFRSSEKTFQLLTQVGGRAGRHQIKGEVVIQTYTPEHYSIQFARGHDYTGFYQKEIGERMRNQYPPFSRLILFTFIHEHEQTVVKTADQFARRLGSALPKTVAILGPVPSPIARIKNRYRYQCVLKYGSEQGIPDQAGQLVREFEQDRSHGDVQIVVDVDPQYLM